MISNANGVARRWRDNDAPAGKPLVFAHSTGTDLRR